MLRRNVAFVCVCAGVSPPEIQINPTPIIGGFRGDRADCQGNPNGLTRNGCGCCCGLNTSKHCLIASPTLDPSESQPASQARRSPYRSLPRHWVGDVEGARLAMVDCEQCRVSRRIDMHLRRARRAIRSAAGAVQATIVQHNAFHRRGPEDLSFEGRNTPHAHQSVALRIQVQRMVLAKGSRSRRIGPGDALRDQPTRPGLTRDCSKVARSSRMRALRARALDRCAGS
jgi:hypothetical protein